MVRVRFAPSPTGPLHIGGVRTALFNYLFAKKNAGTFILRIEDTDQTRYVQGAEEYIMDSLEWLGIKFDEGIREGGNYGPYRQSERKDIYEKFCKILLDKGKAYIAFDTPEELEALRKEYESKGQTFTYNYITRKSLKNSLTLGQDETQKLINSGVPYVVRFLIPKNEIIEVYDEIRDNVKFNSNELDDKVLMKADGLPTYHLANIVDDHLMKITHVIRGEEWLPSLPLHVLLYRAFEWEAPKFAHLPLILKPNGKGKLSKRDGDQMGFPVFPLEWNNGDEIFRGYREDGYLPEAVINMLALLGWNPGTEQEIFSMDELIETFSIERVGKSGSRFDPDKAKWFNHQYIMKKDGEELAKLIEPILKEENLNYNIETLPKICNLIKERVNFVKDIISEGIYFFKQPETYEEKFFKKAVKENTPEILRKLIEILENTQDFSSTHTENAVKSWLEKTQLGFGQVMPAFRLALVGEGKGPHVFDITEIIGKEETINRLYKFLNYLG
ncbi:MAG: glutamate--tRNA ligase [Bacteroidales bacterium]